MDNKNIDFIVDKIDHEDGKALMSESDGTQIITTLSKYNEFLNRAIAQYNPENKLYSSYLNDTGTASTLTTSLISSLAENIHNNLSNIISANQIIRKYIDMDDLIGMVVQSISNNINTEIKLFYRDVDGRNKNNTMKKVKSLIDDFNYQVDLPRFIRDAILLSYIEGNYVALLRNKNENWQIDYLPLSIIENSGYENNGNPIILVNINNLTNALDTNILRDKKRNPLFFENIGEIIKNTYPESVYNAYINKETYAVLDDKYTGMVRVNNMRRKYGLSPIFRALSSTIMLNDYQNADESTAKSKAKKVIHQKMREKLLDVNGQQRAWEEMAFAHDQLMSAWKNKTVIYTSGPAVESVEYVEPKTEEISVEKVNIYRNKVLSSLGVAFLANDKSQTASTAYLNLSQLMKCINGIAEQVERIIVHFYQALLSDNNIDISYCPKIKIIDSEMLEMEMKMDLAKLLYTTFGCSRETSLGLVGVDLDDERIKREYENSENYNEIFSPYPTSYNTNGSESGRPSSTDPTTVDKREYDDTYNENR